METSPGGEGLETDRNYTAGGGGGGGGGVSPPPRIDWGQLRDDLDSTHQYQTSSSRHNQPQQMEWENATGDRRHQQHQQKHQNNQHQRRNQNASLRNRLPLRRCLSGGALDALESAINGAAQPDIDLGLGDMEAAEAEPDSHLGIGHPADDPSP